MKDFYLIEILKNGFNKIDLPFDKNIISANRLDSFLFFCTSSKIYKYNINNNTLTKVADTIAIIYDAAFTKNKVYAATSSNEFERYSNSALYYSDYDYFYKINLDYSYNYNNITVNNDGTYLSFLNISNSSFGIPNPNRKVYLLLYDVLENRIDTIDSSENKNDYIFNTMDSKTLFYWSNLELYYIKHRLDRKFLFKYNIQDHKLQVVYELPININLTGICIKENKMYFSTRNEIGVLHENKISWLYKCDKNSSIYLGKIF